MDAGVKAFAGVTLSITLMFLVAGFALEVRGREELERVQYEAIDRSCPTPEVVAEVPAHRHEGPILRLLDVKGCSGANCRYLVWGPKDAFKVQVVRGVSP